MTRRQHLDRAEHLLKEADDALQGARDMVHEPREPDGEERMLRYAEITAHMADAHMRFASLGFSHNDIVAMDVYDVGRPDS